MKTNQGCYGCARCGGATGTMTYDPTTERVVHSARCSTCPDCGGDCDAILAGLLRATS